MLQAGPILFDTATSTLSYVGTLLAGLLTGAVGGAVVTAGHERAERFRERMMTAATDSLSAYDESAIALHDLSVWVPTTVQEFLSTDNLDALDSGGFPHAVGVGVGVTPFPLTPQFETATAA